MKTALNLSAKNKAQSVIEFVFVFIFTIMIFLSIMELCLYWRARFSVQNIANEVVANAQITAQNSSSESAVVNKALQVVKKRSSLLNLSKSGYNVSGSNGAYAIASTFVKKNEPALKVLININSMEKADLTVGVVYKYQGIFLFSGGVAMTSGPAQSVQKY